MPKTTEITSNDLAIISRLPTLNIAGIAGIISHNWKGVNYAARPYLDAMYSLDRVTDSYGMDSGKGIILYFLNNASTYRGVIAKEVKKELKKRCGVK